jgi:3-hydroxyacyl-CoA dehydrogenase
MINGLTAKRVCVIGAGTMGSGIAAHLANLGFDVSLLDTTQATVTEAFDRARNGRLPVFYTPDTANSIRLGNTREHLAWIEEADWVCEAIVERVEAKQALYADIESRLSPYAMVSTNTSGIEISLLASGRSDAFRRRFIGAHFFNPPRHLKLLELIPTAETDPTVIEDMTRFLEESAARRVVRAKDTPGFIANRFGMWCMFHAIHVAERLRLSVEQVDAITGHFLGRPKSGSFLLNDIVGLDVMRDIAANLLQRCPNDPQISEFELPDSMLHLLARGWLGQKTGHGYYRRETKEVLVLDLNSFVYQPKQDVDLRSLARLEELPLNERIPRALELRDEVGEYLRHYLVPALRYADYLKEQISHSVLDFDHVMEWGFGWRMGPFALIDAIGAANLGVSDGPFYQGAKVRTFGGQYVARPSQPEYKTLAEYEIVDRLSTCVLRALGDGVTAVSLTTKLGVITPAVVDDLTQLVKGRSLKRFVLTSEARSFSAGFDLKFFQDAIRREAWREIEDELLKLQQLGELLERADCVAAVHGHCLGAGLELALSCGQIVADAETQIGLPEAKVGLIPGGRGVTLMRQLNQSSARRLCEVALTLSLGETAPTAEHARVLGYLRATDRTVYHPDRLIFEAKRAVMSLTPSVRPAWAAVQGPLVGIIDRELDLALARGDLSDFDSTIGHKIKQIFARSSGYPDALLRERTEFVDLCRRALTHARIHHMLENGKPLRN